MVNIDSGDRPAERMMIEVTFPIEQAVRAVPGVRNVRSTTSRGSAEISINFDWGEDMVAAMLQVESAINQVMPSLPQGTTFNARRMDPTVFPVLAYSLTSDTHSLVDLRDIALYQLRPLTFDDHGSRQDRSSRGRAARVRSQRQPGSLGFLRSVVERCGQGRFQPPT